MLKIIDKPLFMNPYGEIVNQNNTIMMKQIPRQLPKGVDAELLTQNSKDSGKAVEVFFIIQIIISVILKGSIDYIFSLFLTLQMIVHIDYFSINIPANIEMFLEEISKIVRFQLLKPDFLMGYFSR